MKQWGSNYFIQHPLYPLEKITSAFVLDCVGLGKNKFWLFGAKHFNAAYEELEKNLKPEFLKDIIPRKESGSDQYFFQEKEITSFFAHNISQKSWNHTPEDDPEVLNPKILKKIADFIYEAAVYFANR